MENRHAEFYLILVVVPTDKCYIFYMPHDHNCHHDHDHSHGHGHSHAPADFGRAFAIGIALNTTFVAAEIFWGLKANSLALLADAGHNVSDVLGLAMAWLATVLSRREPFGRFTYGLRGSSILAATANAVLLLIAVGAIGWESVLRLMNPQPAIGAVMMWVAAFGVVINGATAMLFMSGRKGNINVRAAFQHMAGDAMIALGVVIAGAIILKTNWLWLDPLVSLAISLLIVMGTWGLLKESFGMSLQAVPKSIEVSAVKAYLAGVQGVTEVHDLHIWPISTTEIACTVHLITPGGHPGDACMKEIAHHLDDSFNISHTTIQIEIGDSGNACPLASDHVV
jgi:cobalt-zinc-cadmium efflux system protein